MSQAPVAPGARRLVLQSQLYESATRGFLTAAGLRAGMRVLDVGSGVGDVALLLADLVGPAGSVIGVEADPVRADMATVRLADAGLRNAEVVAGDVETLDVDAPFDAVVGRFVLRELSDATATVARLAGLLVPGGIVAFQEKLLTIPVTSVPRLPTLTWITDCLDETRRRAGVELEIAAQLPQIFAGAGLRRPSLTAEAPVGWGAEWLGFEYLLETFRHLLPASRALDVVAEEVDFGALGAKLREEATDGCMVLLTPCVGATTEHPGRAT